MSKKQCTLQVNDEVNVKITGLDSNILHELNQQFKLEIPGAKYFPSVKLGRWDGKIAFFSKTGRTYINLLPQIVPILQDNKYDIGINDMRDYRINYEIDNIDANSYDHINWPQGHTDENRPIILRDYQVDMINQFIANPQSIQEVATGAGKTIVTAALSERCNKHGRTIVIVPNKSLVTQTEDDYLILGLDVGVYFGDRKDTGKRHTICTWQSLNNLSKDAERLDEFLEGVVCVIVDECHQAKADVLQSLLTKRMAKIPIRWGLTGTVPQDEFASVGLISSIGFVTNRISAKELQEKGILANCHVNILQLIDSGEYRNYQSELKYLTTDESRLSYIANIVNVIKENGNTLVLVDRIATGEKLYEYLSELRNDVVFISGVTKTDKRKEHYDDIKETDYKIIIATYGVAGVGLNIPRIFNLVLIEPGKSFIRVIQSIGRGIRRAKDKDFVQIWDITSTCRFSKRHLTIRKRFYKDAKYPFSLNKEKWNVQ